MVHETLYNEFLDNSEELNELKDYIVKFRDRVVPALNKIATVDSYWEFATNASEEFRLECDNAILMIENSEIHDVESIQEQVEYINELAYGIEEFLRANQAGIRKAFRG